MADFNWYMKQSATAEASNIRVLAHTLTVDGSASAVRVGFAWWLSDTVGGGLTSTAPSTVVFKPSTAHFGGGGRLKQFSSKKFYQFATSTNGVLLISVGFASTKTWYVNTCIVDGHVWTDSVAFS